MESGFSLNDPKDFASRIYSTVKSSLNISPDAAVEEEDDVEENDADTEMKESSAAKEDVDTEYSGKDEL